ncbi:MAG: hypothetical protein M3442_03520 [Chloroflexota bacterium]|nr:hypothetical protein [Chloroflexota bacterium]
MARRNRVPGSGRRLGQQPPRYRFFLNPYPDVRFTTCPQCGDKTRVRKLPLVIHIDPMQLVALNKTCRYCPSCDLLIAHRDELEAWLAAFFGQQKPEVVGNDYLVVGTEDRATWHRGTRTPRPVQELLAGLHDFAAVVRFEPAARWRPA